MEKFIYVKLTKVWSRYGVGDVVRFGYNKGKGRIREGFGIEVPEQNAVNAPLPKKEKPKVETAAKEPVSDPKVETAEKTPKVTKKSAVKGSSK